MVDSSLATFSPHGGAELKIRPPRGHISTNIRINITINIANKHWVAISISHTHISQVLKTPVNIIECSYERRNFDFFGRITTDKTIYVDINLWNSLHLFGYPRWGCYEASFLSNKSFMALSSNVNVFKIMPITKQLGSCLIHSSHTNMV